MTQLNELFTNFIGLGNNCEFGIVVDVASQGVSNAGLFHAVGFHETQQIINAIEAGLAGMFEEGQYAIAKPNGWPDHAIDCLRYGFRFHTGVPVNLDRPEAELHKRLVAFRFRKSLFLESLSAGDAIFVYRNNEVFDSKNAQNLFRAIRRHGSGKLLYVRQDPSQRFASVEEQQDGLYYGAVSRLSNENPPVIDFTAWEKIARTILNTPSRAKVEPVPPPPDQFPDATVQVHQHHSGRPFFFFVTEAVPNVLYQFEAMVYLPGTFRGGDVSLALLGWPSERWTQAALNLRETWQKIVVIARAPNHSTLIVPSLNTSEAASGPVYTTGWTIRAIQSG